MYNFSERHLFVGGGYKFLGIQEGEGSKRGTRVNFLCCILWERGRVTLKGSKIFTYEQRWRSILFYGWGGRL